MKKMSEIEQTAAVETGVVSKAGGVGVEVKWTALVGGEVEEGERSLSIIIINSL